MTIPLKYFHRILSPSCPDYGRNGRQSQGRMKGLFREVIDEWWGKKTTGSAIPARENAEMTNSERVLPGLYQPLKNLQHRAVARAG